MFGFFVNKIIKIGHLARSAAWEPGNGLLWNLVFGNFTKTCW